jgi:hypothetical protein
MLVQKEIARPFGENDREKENASLGTNVSRHGTWYHAAWWARRKGAFAHPTVSATLHPTTNKESPGENHR